MRIEKMKMWQHQFIAMVSSLFAMGIVMGVVFLVPVPDLSPVFDVTMVQDGRTLNFTFGTPGLREDPVIVKIIIAVERDEMPYHYHAANHNWMLNVDSIYEDSFNFTFIDNGEVGMLDNGDCLVITCMNEGIGEITVSFIRQPYSSEGSVRFPQMVRQWTVTFP